MDANIIFQAIGSIGFPIVIAVYMIYVNQKQNEAHANEQKEMTSAINELKLVIQALIDKLGD